ncbi:MAG: DUF502 domain-containing protein [Candidatus Brocadiia bacterium]
MSSLFKTFVHGLVVVAPVVITLYVCVQSVTWLDGTIRTAIKPTGVDIPGLGVFVAFAGIYIIGLLTQNWIFRGLVSLGESIIERIPLVKSMYSAIRDLLQFLGGTDDEEKGRPARISLMDGQVDMLGLVTQKSPENFMGPEEEGRVAVYLPMSYQIGGFTVFMPEDRVEEISDLSVEDVLKLSMTAGMGTSTGNSGEKHTPMKSPSSPSTPPETE